MLIACQVHLFYYWLKKCKPLLNYSYRAQWHKKYRTSERLHLGTHFASVSCTCPLEVSLYPKPKYTFKGLRNHLGFDTRNRSPVRAREYQPQHSSYLKYQKLTDMSKLCTGLIYMIVGRMTW